MLNLNKNKNMTTPTEAHPHTPFYAESVPAHFESASERLFMEHRDVVLHDLLATDYEFAKDSGLLDKFYLDPKAGQDALLHILTGDIETNDTGGIIPGGFHHEPSARDGLTYVERDHIEHRRKADARDYIEVPYNPYAAQIVIEGFRKTRHTKDGITGELTPRPVNNGMFPKEYDALTVMQAIWQALETRDTSKDRQSGKYIITEGRAMLLDGETTMKLRLCLDEETGKVISAFPTSLTKSKMRLTNEDKQKHLGLL